MALAPFHVTVVGSGVSGLISCLALVQSGARVALVAKPSPFANDLRSIALLSHTVSLLEDLGLWEELLPHAAPITRIDLVDRTSRLFTIPVLRFTCDELRLDAFGYNVPMMALLRVLWKRFTRACEEGSAVHVPFRLQAVHYGDKCVRMEFEEHTETIESALIFAADGKSSILHRLIHARVFRRIHQQVALVTAVQHSVAHENRVVEFHFDEGPMTFVPSLDPYRSNLVWMCSSTAKIDKAHFDQTAFDQELSKRSYYHLGRIRTLETPQELSLLTQYVATSAHKRCFFVGEAAHTFPPIGAQGMNLLIREISRAITTLRPLIQSGHDVGEPRVLRQLISDQSQDALVRTFAIEVLNASLINRPGFLDPLKKLSFLALRNSPFLRRRLMAKMITPSPRLRLFFARTLKS